MGFLLPAGFLITSVRSQPKTGLRTQYQLVGPVSTFDSMVLCTVVLTADKMS